MSKSTAPRNVLEGASAEHVEQSGETELPALELWRPHGSCLAWHRKHHGHLPFLLRLPSFQLNLPCTLIFLLENPCWVVSAVRFPARRLWWMHAPTRNVTLGSGDKQRPPRRRVLNRLLWPLLSRTLLPSCLWLWPVFPVWLSRFSDQSTHHSANKLLFYLSYSKPASVAHHQACQLTAHGSRRGTWSKLSLRKATKHSYQEDSLQITRARWSSLTKQMSAQPGTLLRLIPWPVPLLDSTPDLTFHTGIFGGVPWWAS